MSWSSVGIAAAITVSSITITWNRFDSRIYPYSVSQPSSFRHIVIPTDDGKRLDYFAPSLGSYVTNVSISAVRGDRFNSKLDLKDRDGRNVHRSGWLRVLRQRRPVYQGSFQGPGGRWTEQEICFSAGGYAWRLVASYDVRYKKLRPLMLRMLGTFRLRAGSSP